MTENTVNTVSKNSNLKENRKTGKLYHQIKKQVEFKQHQTT